MAIVNESGAGIIKLLQFHNLQKNDRFHGQLVSYLLSVTFTALDKSSCSDKHTSLLRNSHIKNV
jgi:hypothetical protein